MTKIERLQKLAHKAVMARDKFEEALEAAKALPNWEKLIEKDGRGLSTTADAGDWMC
jgi:hypothetical protein